MLRVVRRDPMSSSVLSAAFARCDKFINKGYICVCCLMLFRGTGTNDTRVATSIVTIPVSAHAIVAVLLLGC